MMFHSEIHYEMEGAEFVFLVLVTCFVTQLFAIWRISVKYVYSLQKNSKLWERMKYSQIGSHPTVSS